MFGLGCSETTTHLNSNSSLNAEIHILRATARYLDDGPSQLGNDECDIRVQGQSLWSQNDVISCRKAFRFSYLNFPRQGVGCVTEKIDPDEHPRPRDLSVGVWQMSSRSRTQTQVFNCKSHFLLLAYLVSPIQKAHFCCCCCCFMVNTSVEKSSIVKSFSLMSSTTFLLVLEKSVL